MAANEKVLKDRIEELKKQISDQSSRAEARSKSLTKI